MTPQKLKEIRLRLGLSVERAAEIFRVSYSGWGKWERGERKVPSLLEAAIDFYTKLPKGKRPL